MSKDTLFEVPHGFNRQKMLEIMEIGETISLSHRFDITFGIGSDRLNKETTRLRCILDQQTIRARRKAPGRVFTIESGKFITQAGAILVTVAATRVS